MRHAAVSQDDAADVARLMIGFRDWQGRTGPADDVIESTVRELLVDPNSEFLLGGSPPVGVCQLRYRLSVWTGTDDCCLEDLFVNADVRGSGLGRELVEAALKRARERGCTRMSPRCQRGERPGTGPLQSRWASTAGPPAPPATTCFMRLRL